MTVALRRQHVLCVGAAQADELFRQDFGEACDQRTLNDQQFYGVVGALSRRMDTLRAGLYLLVEEQRQPPELLRVVLVDHPYLLLAAVRRDDLLHVADAEALLHGQDHDEVGDVYPVVLALYRRRHDLQPHIVVDGGGGHKMLLRSGGGGDEAEILLQQHDDLIHV